MDLASAEAEIRHVFGDTPITEASIGAAPPDILVKLSGVYRVHCLLAEKPKIWRMAAEFSRLLKDFVEISTQFNLYGILL